MFENGGRRLSEEDKLMVWLWIKKNAKEHPGKRNVNNRTEHGKLGGEGGGDGE